MKFVVILFCVGLERFFQLENVLQRAKTLNYYFSQMARIFPSAWQQGGYGLFVFLLPLELTVSILYWLSRAYFSSLSVFLLEIIILLYCFGPESTYQSSASFSQHLFEKIQNRLFNVLFWFTLLGPAGAVLYRLIERISSVSSNQMPILPVNQDIVSMSKALLGYLSWMPVRLFSGVGVMLGKFPEAFNYWLDHFLTGWQFNDELITHTGRLALGVDFNAPLSERQYINILYLLDRVLGLFLAMFLISTVASAIG